MTTSTVTAAAGSGPRLEPRPFEPGTGGWTAADLDDPEIEREWFRGRYELVLGVITKMPPAYFAGGNATVNLVTLLKAHSKAHGLGCRFAVEAEIVVDEIRVPRADAALMTPDDQRRQDDAVRAAGRPDPKRTRLLVPPTLIIESVSPGHERHDRQTKRAWYAEFGVPHYWLVDAYQQTLERLRLQQGAYVTDALGQRDQTLAPPAFPGLSIPLRDVWED